MEKKMDLRVVKTKKVIHETFINMRRRMPLEKIKVRELCKEAMINKSTFYNYYSDVYVLSEELEDEMLDMYFKDFDSKDRLFSDPEVFIRDVNSCEGKYQDILYVLFDGRIDELWWKVARKLCNLYEDSVQDAKKEILISFAIGGIMMATQLEKQKGIYDKKMIEENVVEAVKSIFN